MSTRFQQFSPWYPLDNAATLFPSIESDSRTAVFRLSVTLYETVDPAKLQSALNIVLRRFPSFRVKLLSGVFWNVLDSNENPLMVEPDVRNPCLRLDHRRNLRHLLRVRYFKTRVAVEFYHSLTDGSGGMSFLLSLIAQYCKEDLPGIVYDDVILDPASPVDEEELEDAFIRYHNPAMKRPPAEKAAYQMRLQHEDRSVIHHIQAQIKLDQLKEKARSHGVNITAYLSAVYLMALQEQRKIDGKEMQPIRLCIPVNLRTFFKSKTVRNFSHFIKPELKIDAGPPYSFEEILIIVSAQMKLAITDRVMLREFSPNVRSMTNPVLRIMPLFIKNLAIRLVSHTVAEKQFSGMFSNLGNITLPEELSQKIDRLDFQLGPNRKIGSSLSMVGFKDRLMLNFVRSTVDNPVERFFFRELVKRGLQVKVQSNWR